MSGPVVTGPLSLPLPEHWVRIESSEDVLAMAAPDGVDTRFRPNIVMTSSTAAGPLHVVTTQAIAAILALHPGAQVLGVEQDDLADVLGVPSRTLEWSYASERTTVLVRQWIAVIDGVQVHVTGSCAVEEFSDFVPFLRGLLAATSVTSTESASSAPTTSAADDDATTMPRIDRGASERFGATLEALDGVAAAQPRPAGRWMLHDETVQYLWSLRGRGIVSRAQRRSPAGQELAEAHLTGALGALLDDGQRIATHLESARYRFGATAEHGGRSVDWSMWLRGETALVRAKGTVADLVDDRLLPDGPAQFDVLAAGRAVGHLLAWARVSPAWAVASDEPLVIATDVLEARIASVGVPAGPAPIAGFVGDRLWQEPVWVRIRVWGESTPSGLDVIAAGGAGWFLRNTTDDGHVRLEPVPSGTVVRSVLQVFAEPTDV